jgi:hypothetical protein
VASFDPQVKVSVTQEFPRGCVGFKRTPGRVGYAGHLCESRVVVESWRTVVPVKPDPPVLIAQEIAGEVDGFEGDLVRIGQSRRDCERRILLFQRRAYRRNFSEVIAVANELFRVVIRSNHRDGIGHRRFRIRCSCRAFKISVLCGCNCRQNERDQNHEPFHIVFLMQGCSNSCTAAPRLSHDRPQVPDVTHITLFLSTKAQTVDAQGLYCTRQI